MLIKLRKLDNKGMSAVEVVICFTLVSIISISLLNIVMSYKDREDLEGYKQEIISYKNSVTKVIQDDITNYILEEVEPMGKEYGSLCKEYDPNDKFYSEAVSQNNTLNRISYRLHFALSDEVKTLTIDRLNNRITYTEDGKEVTHSLPDFGESSSERVGKYKCSNIKSLRISDISLKEEKNFFIIDVNFYHNKVKLENRYGIHIKAPLGFTTA